MPRPTPVFGWAGAAASALAGLSAKEVCGALAALLGLHLVAATVSPHPGRTNVKRISAMRCAWSDFGNKRACVYGGGPTLGAAGTVLIRTSVVTLGGFGT